MGKLRRYEEAVVAYEKALELSPQDDRMWRMKCYWLVNLQRYQAALDVLEHTITIDPNHVWTWSMKAKAHALYRLWCVDEAYDALDRALARDPNSKLSIFNGPHVGMISSAIRLIRKLRGDKKRTTS